MGRRWGAPTVAAVFVVIPLAAPVGASSYTGAVEYTYEVCNEEGKLPQTVFVTNFVNGVSGGLGMGGSPNQCFIALGQGINSSTEATRSAPFAVANTALGVPDSLDPAVHTIWNVTGHVLGQVERLTGIQVGFSAELNVTDPAVAFMLKGGGFDEHERISVRVSCLVEGCVSITSEPGQQSTGDAASNFEWTDDARLEWTPRSTQNRLDGKAVLNLYTARYQPHEAWDFYASTQWSSARPLDGSRITKVLAEARPDNNSTQVVEADPLQVAKYGSAGSFNLGASLSGEAKFGAYGGGAGFSVGRTWNFAEGTVGGWVASDNTHATQWQAGNSAGSTTAKATAGVETWKVPTNAGITVWYTASAWVKS